MKLSTYSWLVALEPAAQFLRVFRDRADAGVRLATRLAAYRRQNALVLGLVRGGVPVAYEVARTLEADLDVMVTRKLVAPSNPDVCLGAVTADGTRYVNEQLVSELCIASSYIERMARAEVTLAQLQEQRFRDVSLPNAHGRNVILVDDGLASGATMLAAIRAVRQTQPARIIAAVPVASEEACAELLQEADEVVCYLVPQPFWAVGLHYQDFDQIDDAEVERYLRGSLRERLIA